MGGGLEESIRAGVISLLGTPLCQATQWEKATGSVVWQHNWENESEPWSGKVVRLRPVSMCSKSAILPCMNFGACGVSKWSPQRILVSVALFFSMSYAVSAPSMRSWTTITPSSESESCTPTSSMLEQLPVRPGKGKGGKGKGGKSPTPSSWGSRVVMGPKWKASQCSCAFKGCGEPHHIQHCVKAFQADIAKCHTDCVRGVHTPYLHGVWRCQNCGTHLYDEDVKRQAPELHAIESAKEWEKIRRYGAPNLQPWQ